MTSLALDSISVKGFRSIASLDVTLRPINLLIGANGAGKSNFLGAFSFLRAIADESLQTYIRENGGAEQLLHFGAKTTREVQIRFALPNNAGAYHLTLGRTVDDSLFPKQETVTSYSDDGGSRAFAMKPQLNGLEAGISGSVLGPPYSPAFSHFLLQLHHLNVYHLHDTSSNAPIRLTAHLHDNSLLRPDGSNLSSFLYLIEQKHRDWYELIRKTIQRALPFFDDFQLRPDPLNEERIRLAWKHKGSDQYFGASALSDGSLRFIMLATLFLQPTALRPPIVLLDEPELGLHPAAISLLASLIKQASTETQVIVSTQSASLLDYFEPEDVLVAERHAGGTQIKRLEAERLRAWLEDYSLGELWEKNEFGGRPRPD
jgi:predicted ATPase